VLWGVSCVHGVVLWGEGVALHDAPGLLCMLGHLGRLSGTYLPIGGHGSWAGPLSEGTQPALAISLLLGESDFIGICT